jgi:hypothetical protein
MKALAILATVALVLLGRWWRDALSDARLAAVDDIDWLAEYRPPYLTAAEWRN